MEVYIWRIQDNKVVPIATFNKAAAIGGPFEVLKKFLKENPHRWANREVYFATTSDIWRVH